ncbi:MAG: 4Fe-4S binding protein [Alphaproteobacteria bacterium]|jgi:NosR/NirI family transcriptional regulator, nitrous oxide reductase regulator|nr:4Fe-4S binding protein [Alphaproteobacteria bacterium]MBT5861147.1 4Fe-4S binding protein [Alphaproteobacteria bacterium]
MTVLSAWIAPLRRLGLFALCAIGAGLFAAPVVAEELGEANLDKNLLERLTLTPGALQQAFPGADEVVFVDGRPPVVEVWIDGAVVGYLFSTRDAVNATGYSGVAFDLVAGMTMEGDLVGATLLYHHEAIIGRGVPQEKLDEYIASIAGANLRTFSSIRPDYLSRASTSGRLMKRGLLNSAEMVFQGHVLGVPPVTEPTLDRTGFAPFTFEELLASGSILNQAVTNAEMLGIFEKAGGRGSLPDQAFKDGEEGVFFELFTTLITPASIGANLFGDAKYRSYIEDQPEGGLTLWVAGDGAYSFASNSHFRSANDYLFDRLKIVQGALEIRLTRDMHRRLAVSRGPAMNHRNIMLFKIEADQGLDPLAPFDMVLMVAGKDSDGGAMVVDVPITYQLPERHMLLPPPVPLPMWVETWLEKRVDIAILGLLLIVVTIIFLLQDVLARHRRVYEFVRVGVLAFTLGWLGWYAGAQLSIVNILAYIQAPFGGSSIQAFVLDPLIFILSVYVAFTLFVLGRGVFCGWLCPFGAFQELLNRIARFVRIPQISIPPTMLQRLWVVKYLVAIFLVVTVFISVEAAEGYAEIEPFRTAITVKFVRDWQFALYAAGLLSIGLFVERAYCRVLCPLGGTLAVLGRFHMFTWLKRRQACGTQCRICEGECPIGAIEPSGKINMNECLQCLDCQATYYDDHQCPPLIQRRKRKEQRKAGAPKRPGQVSGPAVDGPLIPGAAPAE